tara:strand:- start:20327 stop:22285 length:1959 start_codon:yes stop_codon:yes gene_type:complete
MTKSFPKNPIGEIQKSQECKSRYERVWDLISEFLRGNQWLDWNDGVRKWETAKNYKGNNFLTINRLLPYYRAAYSRLALGVPGVAVLPATESTADITKAQVAQKAAMYWWHQEGIPKKANQGSKWLAKYGTYAIHVYYNTDDGEDIYNPTGEGNVTCDFFSPYDIFFEPDVSTVKESRWIALRRFYDREDLINLYPKEKNKIKDIPPADDVDSKGKIFTKRNPDDRLAVYEWYWRDGRHAITSGRVYLEQSKKYFDPKFFPISIVHYTDVEYDVFALGIMESLIPLQWSYNKSRTRTVRNLDKLGHGKVLAPRGCKINLKEWNDRAGGILHYNAAAGRPEVWSPKVNIPAEIDHVARIQAEMDDLSGIHSVSRGKQVPGIRSGRAIDSLAELDAADMTLTQDSIVDAFTNMFKVALHLMAKHYPKNKIMKMFDIFGEAMFTEIRATDLVTNPDVHIKANSLFRDDAEDRQNKILSLVESGLITKEEAGEAISLHLGADTKVMQRIQGMHHAKFLLRDGILKGHPIKIFISDDIKAIQTVFTEYMRSDEFYEQPEEIQLYIGNVIAAISTHGLPDENYQKAARFTQVWPRQPDPMVKNPIQPSSVIATQGSAGRQQVAEQQGLLAKDVSDVETQEARMAQRREANISPLNKRL